jgi:hypothetical protein
MRVCGLQCGGVRGLKEGSRRLFVGAVTLRGWGPVCRGLAVDKEDGCPH